MAIPDFQSLMLPLLDHLSDGNERTLAELREALAGRFRLTPTELQELLPSGRQSVFVNRVTWAAVYLEKAKLIDRVRRGAYRITSAGTEALKEKPERIDLRYLRQFEPYVSWRHGKVQPEGRVEPDPGRETPEEALEFAYQQILNSLAQDLLDRVKAGSPGFFEQLVVELLVKMGYGGSMRDAGAIVGSAGDEGIDGIIKQDRLGLDVIYVQAKKWEGAVGRPEIQKFVGALHGKHARKGVFITTGSFSQGGREYAATIDPKVVLIDGEQLAGLMIDFGLGVTTHAVYELRRLDSDPSSTVCRASGVGNAGLNESQSRATS